MKTSRNLFAFCCLLLVTSVAMGEEPAPEATPSGSPVVEKPAAEKTSKKNAAASVGKTTGRTKAIDFDEAVVEGINKNPYDAFQHVGHQEGDGPARLYKKKPHFRKENAKILKEMKYTP